MKVIKDLLKGVFPRVFLKRFFLLYNQVKAATWDKLFFKSGNIPNDFFKILEKKNPFLEMGIDVSLFDDVIQNKLSLWTNPDWTQDQYLVMYNQSGYIEPHTGWGVSLNNELIYPSLGFASAPHVRKPSFIETYLNKKSITNLERIISFRDTGEENYFHFFNDVLAKLFFLQDNKIQLDEYSLVVSHKLYGKHYFQYYLSNSFLGHLKWYVQKEDEWIEFGSAIFCKPFTHTKKYFDKAVQLAKPEVTEDVAKRVFLTRSASTHRFIENLSEIEPILQKFNFEAIDSSKLRFEEQIKIFSRCRYLVAIHGAGITNVMFRSGKPLSLLEIVNPSSYVPFHYIMMSKLYNYEYAVMVGVKGRKASSGGFVIVPAEFELMLSSLIKEQ